MSDKTEKFLCIYHADCQDGFSAAWAVWKRFKDEVEFHRGIYGETPPDVAGRHVIMVDFSYKLSVLLEMAKQAASILILDHHKSAKEDLAELPWARSNWIGHLADALNPAHTGQLDRIGVIFDMERSGAVMAWQYFHPNMPVPKMLLHVQDRDLWQFKYHETSRLSAALFSYPYTFRCWDDMVAACENSYTRAKLVDEGSAILRQHEKDIAELLPLAKRTMVIGGVVVPVANLPYMMASDAAHIMAKGKPFAATYYDGTEYRNFSLRSAEDGADVSEVAKKYGGGGHKHAAGFRMPIGWEGDPPETEVRPKTLEINRNPDGTYMDEDQIFADLPKRVTDAHTLKVVRQDFKYTDEDIVAHNLENIDTGLLGAIEYDAFGRWIRNSYGLWRDDNPHVVLDPPANAEGFIDHPQFPDNMSARIIERFVKQLSSAAPSLGELRPLQSGEHG